MKHLVEDGGDEVWYSTSESDTEEIGAELARRFEAGGTALLLVADLGSGKTVLVRGMARHLGIQRRQVQSPTYNLIHEYEGEHGRLVHVDLYRLEPHEAEAGGWDSLGLDELLAGEGIKAVEWAERLPWTPRGSRRVELLNLGGSSREIRLIA
ncbi:MAG: tRNA (adenosine(37)-N6)-threonylcarbamoyltransferase complex ATPase subunit type 1 TsaE [Thermoanaerobaculia bacterium]|nr:tRNA (adenosine(37)-N6)-threonylcarbamoyltransferase complex ATPase subunit type 1 TsaE [Thermoanaerobaculia bacterium]